MKTTTRSWPLMVLAGGVALNGLLLIASTLEYQVRFHGVMPHVYQAGDAGFGLPLIAGLTLLYLSMHLRRGKQTAWQLGMVIYGFVLGLAVSRALLPGPPHFGVEWLTRSVLLPLALLGGLVRLRPEFTVKSDTRSFRDSLRFIVAVLLVTFVYGVSGFLLLDKHDFRHDITLSEAMHRTVDQVDLTTHSALAPQTRRGHVFVDSLTIMSVGAVAYGLISLFQPLRSHLIDQTKNRRLAQKLLETYPASSEDFFKLWPRDKLYFFDPSRTAGLAYRVQRHVALVVGDPFGRPQQFDALLSQFEEYCRTNDWALAFIHTEPQHNDLYARHDFAIQKIGQEAVVDIERFMSEVRRGKYFRQISSRFEKQNYTAELLTPPHSDAVVRQLSEISQEWLTRPGRSERGFILGYFSVDYIQQCRVMVLRDEHGKIQAFINQIRSFDSAEANFDMLRHAADAPGNSNDFLLLKFIGYLQSQGFVRFNLGLCPLAGLDDQDAARGLIDNTLRFIYANGDRFYSFSGLQRFKAKYQPQWQDRYVIYRGGVPGFTRAAAALARAMRIR